MRSYFGSMEITRDKRSLALIGKYVIPRFKTPKTVIQNSEYTPVPSYVSCVQLSNTVVTRLIERNKDRKMSESSETGFDKQRELSAVNDLYNRWRKAWLSFPIQH